MRQIKFRGEAPNGKVYYGDLSHFNNGTFITDMKTDWREIRQAR